MFLKLLVVLPLIVVLLGVRIVRPTLNTFGWALLWLVAAWIFLTYGFKVPIPASVVKLYMGIATLAIAAYVSSSRERWDGFYGPIERLATDPGKRLLLVAALILIPAGTALAVYRGMTVPIQAPLFGRTVHPAPPDKISVHSSEVNLITGDSPIRHLKQDDPAAWEAHLENGRRVYFQNCFYCHGDFMGGDGMFAYALNPIPSNFQDPGVLPMLQETFVLWRVSKGGPGLPEEGGPWDTAMPAWETFLTAEELWDVTAFVYEFPGYAPRSQADHH
jgi:mono/diheme cytochrome c family protein